jgi:serine/threonine protein kinase
VSGVPGVDGFDLVERVGEGRWGSTYGAVELASGQVVALKVADDPASRTRVNAAVSAALRRPADPDLAEPWASATTRDGRPCIVMELARESLFDSVVGLGPLQLNEIVRVALHVAGTLGRLHAAGVVHGDLRPTDLLLDELGRGRLSGAGFAGIAKTPFPVGPVFMAPEVAEGHPAGPPADVYGLAALLFFAISGTAPVGRQPGETELAFVLRHNSQPPPPVLRPDVPEQVAEVVAAALRIEPAERPRLDEVVAAVSRAARLFAPPAR